MKDSKLKQDFSWFWQQSPDVFVSLTQDGKILEISGAATSMLAYNPDDLQGRFLIELVVNEDVASTSRWLSELASSAKMRLPLEVRMIRQDGLILTVSWDGIWANKERMILCVGRDVTDRNRVQQLVASSESRIRTILESMPSGILVCDMDGRIEDTNRACQAMFATEAANLRGKNFVDLLSTTERQRWSFDLLVEQAERAPVELSFAASISVQFGATCVEIGSQKKYVLSLIDITDRKQLEKIRQDVFSVITHELRSPLSAVQGILEMLGEGTYGEITETAADRIVAARRNVSRLLQVLDTVLDAHKIQDGKVHVNLQPTSLDAVIDEAVDSIAGMAERKNVTVRKSTANLVVLADNIRLQQVLVNLLSNAVKATPRGSTIEVNVQAAESGVVVEVADMGRGIPEEFHPLIFEKFEQIPGSYQSQAGSTGLGLTICKNIVDQHGGRIGVRPNQPTGSIFWFFLPHNCGELPRAQEV